MFPDIRQDGEITDFLENINKCNRTTDCKNKKNENISIIMRKVSCNRRYAITMIIQI